VIGNGLGKKPEGVTSIVWPKKGGGRAIGEKKDRLVVVCRRKRSVTAGRVGLADLKKGPSATGEVSSQEELMKEGRPEGFLPENFHSQHVQQLETRTQRRSWGGQSSVSKAFSKGVGNEGKRS